MSALLHTIVGTRPIRRVTNEELLDGTGLPPGWIEQRTGIVSRFTSERSVDVMAKEAAALAITTSGLDPRDIDQVIVVTESSVYQSPPLAPQVAASIGATRAGGFDLVAACAGFTYGLGVARDLVVAGSARVVLVVAAEQMSIWLDRQDLMTAPVFGDGAGAAIVVEAAEPGIWPAASIADGDRHGLIGMSPAGWRRAFESDPPAWPVVRMDGPAVYRWVIVNGPRLVDRALELAECARTDVELFVPHQANLRITQELAKRAGLDGAVVADDIRTSGNTSSASIPLALAGMLDRGEAAPGQLALCMGFGAGMTASAQVIRVPQRFAFAQQG